MKTNYFVLYNLLLNKLINAFNKLIVLLILSICPLGLSANNLAISNVLLTTQNITDNYSIITFNVSWDNSWRTSTLESNWDAAWIFIKFKLSSGSTWSHATMNYVNGTAASDGHTPPANCTITTPSDGKGIFIYRSANMAQGSVSYTNVQLRWNYGVDGLMDDAIVDVAVFGIEMVYVPQGSFYVGDGTTTTVEGQLNVYNGTGPFQIISEGALTLGGSTAGNLRNNNSTGIASADDFNNTTTKALPAAFPKGYNDFYCMKYELTQQQFVDFINKLNRAQQDNKVSTNVTTDAITNIYVMTNTSIISYRNGIVCPSTGNGTTAPIIFSTSMPAVPCNFLHSADKWAYADWSGLRPMTELEYEKACRGTLSAVANEYPWGSTVITQATGITNSGTSTEVPSNATANSTHGSHASVQGPMRVGCFAGGSRVDAGAAYYGMMNMSGSLWELVIPIGNATGRAFTGTHGDGILSVNGYGTNSDWPSYSGGEIINGTGSGIKGGSWSSAISYSRISDRDQINAGTTARVLNVGARYVRTAP